MRQYIFDCSKNILPPKLQPQLNYLRKQQELKYQKGAEPEIKSFLQFRVFLSEFKNISPEETVYKNCG